MKQGVKINYEGGHFPNEKQTLLLKSALSPQSEAIEYFIQWLKMYGLENLDIESETFLSDFIDTIDLGSYRMLPLVIHNVGENNHPYFKLLLGTRKNFWVINKQTAFHAQKVQQVFDKNNIPNILIKGLDMASRYYQNDTLRPMYDGDVLVPYRYREQALKLATDSAFGNKIATFDFHMKDYLHAIHLDFNGLADVDLHWNIFPEYSNDLEATDFIWKNLETVTINNVPTKRMSDTHAFFVSLVHGRGYDTTPPFRWVADVVMIMRSAKNIDWNELLKLTRRFHFKPFLKRAFPYLKQEFGVDIPDFFLSELDKMQPENLEVRYYQLLAKNTLNNNYWLPRLWFSINRRMAFYQLFLKNSQVSLISHFTNWYLDRIKAEYFIRKNG